MHITHQKNFSANEDQKSSVAFFSLEMSSEQLSTRILSEQSKIKSNDIRRGKITEEELNRYIETSKEIYNLPLYIDETPAITIATLSNRARRMKRLLRLSLICSGLYTVNENEYNSSFEGESFKKYLKNNTRFESS